MPLPVLLRAFAAGDFRACTFRICQALDAAGAVILLANPLGSMGLALAFELDASRASVLMKRLEESGATLDEASRRALEGVAASAQPGDERSFLVHIDFAHDGPDEKTEVPRVPG